MKGDPFTPFPNALLDALCAAPLRAGEFRVALYVGRREFGFHLDRVHDKQSTMGRKTKMPRQKVSRILQRLHRFKIVVTHTGDKRRLSYGFERDPKKWRVVWERKVHPPRAVVTYGGDKSVTSGGDELSPDLSLPWVQPSYKETRKRKILKKGVPPPRSSAIHFRDSEGRPRRRGSEEQRKILDVQRELLRLGISDDEFSNLKGMALKELEGVLSDRQNGRHFT